MRDVVETIVQILGVVVFAVGYFRRSRNLMLLGAVMTVLATGWDELVRGFMDGIGAK